MRILIIEDERLINNNIKAVFQNSGFAVDQAFSGEEGISKGEMTDYDLLIVDINLPQKNGIEALEELRQKGKKAPAIFLTARDSFDDMERAFDSGADDYLVKPFPLNVLVMKAQALIKRSVAAPALNYQLADLIVNIQNKQVLKDGGEVVLTAKEYAILEYLLLHANSYVTAEELVEHVWNEDANEFSSAVKTHISNLRSKIGDVFTSKKGLGYRIDLKH